MQESQKIPQGSPVSLLIFLITLVSMACATGAYAQFIDVFVPPTIEAGRSANIVAEWGGGIPLRGVAVETTPRLGLTSVRFTCTDAPAALSRERSSSGGFTHKLVLRQPVRGKCTVVFTVTAASNESTDSFRIDPILSDARVSHPNNGGLRVVRSVVTLPGLIDSDNRVGTFSPDDDARVTTGVSISLDESFTTEFWMRTTRVDQVILGTWDGRDDSSYPLDIVVEPGGRIVVYTGEPGLHESMSTTQPVADGQWHHVAVSNNAGQNKARLVVDGQAVDSLIYKSSMRREGILSVAGRASIDSGFDAGSYIGDLDELRIWSVDRTVREIDQSRRRSGVASGELKYTLDFEDAEAEPDLRRGLSSLAFDAPVEPILANVTDRTVTLEWKVPTGNIIEFVVEESANGSSFEAVGQLDAQGHSDESVMRFAREDVQGRVVYYRVKQVFQDRSSRYSDTVKIGLGTFPVDPEVYISNYPNPFSSETTLSFEVVDESHVTLSVWDITGQSVTVLVDKVLPAGTHEAIFQASDLPSGVYFARFESGSIKQSHKITLAR
ncbi:MAG: T9SS type A sorting domain-containing protein [Rhodothermales bacterium]|nr:T9SS type A sorting domain-containing protein [Rhodothermales bacterium]